MVKTTDLYRFRKIMTIYKIAQTFDSHCIEYLFFAGFGPTQMFSQICNITAIIFSAVRAILFIYLIFLTIKRQ